MQRQLPSADLAYPIEPQEWHFRQSVDYSVSLNRAVLDYASRMRETLLFNIAAMGRRSIARGTTDTWTPNPKRYAEVASRLGAGGRGGGGGDQASQQREAAAWGELRKPELRDPRAYIIPADQDDLPTALKFLSALRETGITVHRATRDFEVQGKRYGAGSYVVMTAQSFRPHVIDMFEPQVHPDVFPIPGGPPTPPYDNAGWTLALQMGVAFDRELEGVTGPFEKVNDWNIKAPTGRVANAQGATGFLSSRRVNNAYIAVNRLLAAGEAVSELRAPLTVDGRTYPPGTFYVRARGSTRRAVEAAAMDLGVHFDGVRRGVAPNARALRPARVGLWDQYGGSMDAGWARWILEQFEFPFERVFPQALDAGGLNAKYDVLVFVDGGIPATGDGGGGRGGAPPPTDIPAEYQSHVGRVTAERTIPQLRAFIQGGGTVIAIGGSATNLARQLDLPVTDHLVENGQPLPRTRFYTPGSVLAARFDVNQPIAYGLAEVTHVFFDDSPVFRLAPGADTSAVRRVGWFDSATPLRSGWSWGQRYLENGLAAVEVSLGKGRVVLFGPEVLKRAQPHPTFKLLFNGIYASASR
jgi:hypothetical protein